MDVFDALSTLAKRNAETAWQQQIAVARQRARAYCEEGGDAADSDILDFVYSQGGISPDFAEALSTLME